MADAANPPSLLPEPTASLPERLLEARERKGVDLYRAERDTKIRARYLAALERGDYRELPGAVYTKGFLRNYALYLGLDPDDVLLQWRRERGDAPTGTETGIVAPKPLTAPRRGFTFSIGLLVAVVLTVGVLLFVGYLGFQLLRFSRPPEIAVTDPVDAVSTVDEAASTYTLRGTSLPGALVSVMVAGRDQPIRIDRRPRRHLVVRRRPAQGSQRVQRQRDRPRHRQDGGEPGRGRDHRALLDGRGADAHRGPAGRRSDVRERGDPGPGHHHERDQGDGHRRHRHDDAGDRDEARRRRRSHPLPRPSTWVRTGRSALPVELTGGHWTLTVTAASAEGKTTSITRAVTVKYQGVNLVVAVKGGPAWMKVWVDGQLDPSVGFGKLFKDGKTLSFTGQDSVEVFTGSSGVTYFTLNGTKLGRLGKPGAPETWLFAPPDKPRQTNHR